MTAMVEDFLDRREAELGDRMATQTPDAVLMAYIEQLEAEQRETPRPGIGLLAALVENPEMLDPVRIRERGWLDRIRNNARDPEFATLVFLALHGVRNMKLLNVEVISDEEATALTEWLSSRLKAQD